MKKIINLIKKIINKIFYYYLIIKKINNLNNKLNKLIIFKKNQKYNLKK
jgi:hypothetical protein